jgi:hypothetical protein
MQMAIADEEEFKAETRRKWHCGRQGGSGRRDFDRELLYILDRIFRSNSNDIIRTRRCFVGGKIVEENRYHAVSEYRRT